MKTTFIKILIGASVLMAEISTFAADSPQPVAGGSSPSSATVIYTSEKVPGALCDCVTYSADGGSTTLPSGYTESIANNPDVTNNGNGTYTIKDGATIKPYCGDPATRKYKCTVQSGLTGFQNIFASIVKTVVYIVMLLGVLAIVGLGIAWAWAGGEDVKMKSNLKHWAVNVLVGLIILFFFRYILTFLAPWIFQ